jgi:predicted dienelactone hydrolase
VLLSRFFNTKIGEKILTQIGQKITIRGGGNGKYALRSALVQAALDTQGLTLLNFLQKLPNNMQLQGEHIFGLVAAFNRAAEGRKLYLEDMEKWTAEEASIQTPFNFTTLPDIRKQGEFEVQKETWNLNDTSRNRQFYVDVYKPQRWRSGKTPVVIISHGLALSPKHFAELAKHLASYGYVVTIPQHPGSDNKRVKEALLEGYFKEVFDVNEFINRPKDVSYVLDELQRRNQSEFAGRLDLESVGVFGHSFGGYTALAVAGAEIDFQNLEQDCKNNQSFDDLDIALLLECQALELPRQVYSFRDSRVKAIIALNSVNHSIFGIKGLSKISIPVMLAQGVTTRLRLPSLEQARSFTWLTTPNKYLVMEEGTANLEFSQLDKNIKDMIDKVNGLNVPSPQLLLEYGKGMPLAFFEMYIDKNADFRPYLQSNYVEYLNQKKAFQLNFISAASSDKLAKAIEKFMQEN